LAQQAEPKFLEDEKEDCLQKESKGQKRQYEASSLQDKQSNKKARKQLNNQFSLENESKIGFADILRSSCSAVYKVDIPLETFIDKIERPRREKCHFCFPCFTITKACGVKNPAEVATKITASINSLGHFPNEFAVEVTSKGPYINITLSAVFLSQIIPKILDNSMSFVDPLILRENEKEVVMVEYSQPNTHKQFHVGHMRNAAIGDCLVRLYKHLGHEVIAANYFGDEGTHVAKCCWYLDQLIKNTGLDLDSVEQHLRAEFLGTTYVKAHSLVSLDTFTEFPLPSCVVGKVTDKKLHPKSTKKKVLNICTVEFGGDKPATVVCGGEDKSYDIGDLVVYAPVGGSYKGKRVEEKNIAGVMSCGVIYSVPECQKEARNSKGKVYWPENCKTEEELIKEAKEEAERKKNVEENMNKKKKSKKKKQQQKSDIDTRILILNSKHKVGENIILLGLKEGLSEEELPKGETPLSVIKRRKAEIQKVLTNIEAQDKYWVELCERTKEWSLHSFKEIYKWLDCHFDHDFYESEMSHPSQKVVDEYLEKKIFEVSEGAVGCRLDKFNLPFCLLRKSNGAGLYATKDIALAIEKFSKFDVQRSIYIVDISQQLHLQQVFATLEQMSFEQANKCIHLPYAMVVAPDGKMSSRLGNVIMFNDLKKELGKALDEGFINSLEYNNEEKASIRRATSVGCIRYGMLNHDVQKDIVFDLDEWTKVAGGNNGPYLMYAYARASSICDTVQASAEAVIDFKLLNGDPQCLEILLKLADFQHQVERTVKQKNNLSNPSILCNYLFDLCQSYSSWYANCIIKHQEDENFKLTLLKFVEAFSKVLGRGLELLGVPLLKRM